MPDNAAAEQLEKMPKHGEFCWTEIATDNLESCRNFYAKIFGWEIRKSGNSEIGMDYLEFAADGRDQGGIYEMKPEFFGGEKMPPHFHVYIAVENVDETAGRAFDLGATIVIPPCDIPGVGRFCMVKDPTGAIFSLLTVTH